MSSELRFDGKVAIVTGAGRGLGRAYALMLAERGARVLVNDNGVRIDGSGGDSVEAMSVVEAIHERGGEAEASVDSVLEGERVVEAALDHFGRVDIVVNNAGILRDHGFANISEEDFSSVLQVQLTGGFRITRAVWPHLCAQSYGRVLFTTAATGMYGSYARANHGAAAMGVLGFATSLAVEGGPLGIHVNSIAPTAQSRHTDTLLPPGIASIMTAKAVSPLVAWLCHEQCRENGAVFEVGGGMVYKNRWQRSRGGAYDVRDGMTPERLAQDWEEICDFSQPSHPRDVAEALEPMLGNARRARGDKDDLLIDPELALGYEFPETQSEYDERDVALYALGVGAAGDGSGPADLRLVYELHPEGLLVLPTFGVIPATRFVLQLAKEGRRAAGCYYGLERILHSGQETEVRRVLPPRARLIHRAKITDIWDWGRNAEVVTEIRSFDANGEELLVNRVSSTVRGGGGWGGSRGPTLSENRPPRRDPDAVIEQRIDSNQHLLYRLSGDWNPLHVDPQVAEAFGFQRPILHGLCTYGYVGRHVTEAFCDGDPRRLRAVQVRFSRPVFPGETLITEMWREDEERVIFRARSSSHGKDVISRAAARLWPEQRVSAGEAGGERDIAAEDGLFSALASYLADHPTVVAQVGRVFELRLDGGRSCWTLDLRSIPAKVLKGKAQRPDLRVGLSLPDFINLCSGVAHTQQLFLTGRLKLEGDSEAARWLDLLRQLPLPL